MGADEIVDYENIYKGVTTTFDNINISVNNGNVGTKLDKNVDI